MRSHSRFRLAATLAVFALATAACEDEVTVVDDGPVEGQVTIDATNPLGFTYFTFADGGSVVSVADPATSTGWDMAFQRFAVKLNGGISGPGAVSGANLENNAGLDSAEVLALTQADAAAESAISHAMHAVQLDPMDMPLRLVYAQMLSEMGLAGQAMEQVRQVAWIDGQLNVDSVYRLTRADRRLLASLRAASGEE